VIDPLSRGGTAEIEELVRLGRQSTRTPILLISDPQDPGAILHCATLLSGQVWDVIRSDAPLEEYRLRMQHLMRQNTQLAELQDLRYRASHDDLTELLRPLYFQARLTEHYSASERHGLDLALLLIDLDRFGQVNKLFDHTIGDRVLSSVARVIHGSLRVEDVAGRIGGDEFAILLPYTTPPEAAATVRRLCRTVASIPGPKAGDGPSFPVNASIGFETTSGKDLKSVEELRSHAEYALQRAKRAGGNQGVYFRSKSS
jgi:diguanylate cyclase (GGDEF)-like protein